MNDRNRRDRLAMTLKAAVTVAFVGLIVAVVEGRMHPADVVPPALDAPAGPPAASRGAAMIDYLNRAAATEEGQPAP